MNNNIQIPWPEWEITKVIGRGGFGTVYEIQKDIFGKKEYAALKVLSIPESAEEIDELYSRGYDEESISAHFKGYLEDIIGEYSIMVDLKGHANVVYCDEVKYVQHDDGIGWDIFIKMELLKPLNKVTSTEYNEEEVIHLGKDLCNALIYCNQQNIIHRDIKPQNIFVSKNGSCKLGDFGVAKVSDKTMSGTKIGTYEYMAPEVYRAQRYDSRVDIYSLGLVMYWMMNQKCTPFLPLPPQIPTSSEKENARNRRLDGEQLPPPVNGSDRLKAIVLKACAFDPKDRYASAQDMLNALQNMNAANPEPIPEPVDLDIYKEMTFEHTNHPAGKYLSIQVDSKEVHFSVPMDIKDGQTIHLTGKGKYNSATGVAGDLYVTVHIKAAPPQANPLNNKMMYIAIAVIAVVLAIFLIKPKNNASTTPPVNNTPQTPQVSVQTEKPQETTPPATQHKHNWKDATYDAPETCLSCGETRGDSLGYPLTWCKEIENSNNPNAKRTVDVSVGTWVDSSGKQHSDSIKFWVNASMVDTEYITYEVDSKYSKLVLTIANAENNAKDGSNKITVYADGTVVYRSDWINNDTSALEKTIDIRHVDIIKIECDTDSRKNCYCLASGLLYK